MSDEKGVLDINALREGNYWDSFGFDDQYLGNGSMKAFGNQNIGWMDRCNLQIPGQIGNYDSSFVVQRWYARSTIIPEHPIEYAMLRRWAERAYVTLGMGNQPQWQLSLSDLLDRRPRTRVPISAEPSLDISADDHRACDIRDPWPLLVPVRQNVWAQIDNFDRDSFDHLQVYEATKNARVWIHLEGLSLPYARLDNRDQAHKLYDRIATRLIANDKAHRSVEDRICEWLLGQMEKPADKEAAHNFSVVRDAIMEGKHRG